MAVRLLRFVRSSGSWNRFYSKISFDVSKFGLLDIDMESAVNVDVNAIDSIKHPDQNIAYVNYDENLTKTDFNRFYSSWKSNVLKLQCKNDILESLPPKEASCSVEVPIKFNLKLNLGKNANAAVQNLQNDFVTVKISNGSCNISNLLTDKIKIDTTAGDINCLGTIHSNASMNIKKNGAIRINKIIGESLETSTDEGDITIDSLYVAQSSLVTTSGSIKVGQAHKILNVLIRKNGSLDINSLDGNLNAIINDGDVNLFAYQFDLIEITAEKGNVNILLNENSPVRFEITCQNLSLNSNLCSNKIESVNESSGCKTHRGMINAGKNNKQNKDLPVLKVKCLKGSVSLNQKSWIENVLKTLNCKSSDDGHA